MSFDYGTPPKAVIAQNAKRDAILKASSDLKKKSSKAKTKMNFNIPAEPIPAPVTEGKVTAGVITTIPVIVDTGDVKLHISAYDVTVDDAFITVMHPKTVAFSRTDETKKYTITVDGRTYAVNHLGLTFELNSLNMGGSMFFRNDQKRESRSGEDTVATERTEVDQD